MTHHLSASTGPLMEWHCFGGFRIVRDGEPMQWSGVRPRIRAVLRYLTVAGGRAVHREEILAALWPELSERAALNNLHVAMSTLRTFLEPGVARGASRYIVRDGATYRVELGPGDRLDLHAFDRAEAAGRRALHRGETGVAAKALRHALDQYAGDLLPEDGPAEWVTAERDRYLIRATEIAALLATLELDAGRCDSAVVTARRALTLDPYHDDSWRVLITAQQRAGDVAAAARSSHTYQVVLRSLQVPQAVPAVPRPDRAGVRAA
jgi:DNA-binding SARP family transcriptional activator